MNKKEYSTVDLRGTPAFERMKKFLGSYASCRNVCDTYEEEKRLGLVKAGEEVIRDVFYDECRTRCAMIELFIKGLECTGDEKHLLWLHYVQGLSLEAVSERLYVSRSTAFRISKRAEEAALIAFMRIECDQKPPQRSVS